MPARSIEPYAHTFRWIRPIYRLFCRVFTDLLFAQSCAHPLRCDGRGVLLERRRPLMIRKLISAAWVALACVIVLPTAAHAQSAIAGVVKDTSGAVLPGVTVEA